MSTKQKIFEESLNLFSINGFEAVSMRDIGAAVGIRESSIYKHYASKQAILDDIVERAKNELDSLFINLKVPSVDSSVGSYGQMKIEDIARLCSAIVIRQMDNEIIAKFRRILTIEQYRNKDLRKIYVEVFMESQLKRNEKIFEYLLNNNILQGTSAKNMALEFFAPFFMLQYKIIDDRELLEKKLMEHATSFINEHLKGE